jgi:hypothetical protein
MAISCETGPLGEGVWITTKQAYSAKGLDHRQPVENDNKEKVDVGKTMEPGACVVMAIVTAARDRVTYCSKRFLGMIVRMVYLVVDMLVTAATVSLSKHTSFKAQVSFNIHSMLVAHSLAR